jgi:lysophospholipase L1-like esterase
MESRICFVGDSFVNGTSDPEYLGWPGRLCRAGRAQGHHLTCYNLGVRGATSRDVLSWWEEEALRRLPGGMDGRLVFAFGANDTRMVEGELRVQPEESLMNAIRILRRAKQLRPLLMVGPPPLGDELNNRRIEFLSNALDSICREEKIPFLGAHAPLLRAGTWLKEAAAGDGAHPGAGGYGELAALVESWSAWREWLASPD